MSENETENDMPVSDTLLVMTGVTGLPELVGATPELRPSFIAADLTGLLAAHPAPTMNGTVVETGGWTASVRDGGLQIDGEGNVSDWWRAVAVAGWQHLDRTGTSAATRGLVPPEPAGSTGDGSLPA